MKTLTFNPQYEDFIQKVVTFCKAIDRYYSVLGIDTNEIEPLKGDLYMVRYLDSHYYSFPFSLMQYNIQILHNRFDNIMKACRKSKRYTRQIGVELGLETEEERSPLNMLWNLWGNRLGLVFDKSIPKA